jgi:hypothetical protein
MILVMVKLHIDIGQESCKVHVSLVLPFTHSLAIMINEPFHTCMYMDRDEELFHTYMYMDVGNGRG